MSIRITGGYLKNRSLKSNSKNPQLRPTIGVIRQAVFNILQDLIEESVFLDLFAGTGVMGIEAISRGALKSVFIERDRKTSQLLKQNLEKLGVEKSTLVLPYDYKKALKIERQYDIVYVDAPYDYYDEKEFVEDLLKRLKGRLASGAHVFIEERFSKEKELNPSLVNEYELLSSRKYGSSLLHLYQLK